MTELLLEKLNGLSGELAVLILAMLPVSELRGAIPAGVLFFKLDFVRTVSIAIVGNLIPVFPILLFFDRIEQLMRMSPLPDRCVDWFVNRAVKRSEKIKRFGPIGLLSFVAIPLPVTGAWTGSLVAFLLGFNVRKSFLYISLGVCVAAVIVSVLTGAGVLVLHG